MSPTKTLLPYIFSTLILLYNPLELVFKPSFISSIKWRDWKKASAAEETRTWNRSGVIRLVDSTWVFCQAGAWRCAGTFAYRPIIERDTDEQCSYSTINYFLTKLTFAWKYSISFVALLGGKASPEFSMIQSYLQYYVLTISGFSLAGVVGLS